MGGRRGRPAKTGGAFWLPAQKSFRCRNPLPWHSSATILNAVGCKIAPCREALPVILASLGRSAPTGVSRSGWFACSLGHFGNFQGEVAAENQPRGSSHSCCRAGTRGCISQHHGPSGLDGDVPSWHVTPSAFLVHVSALKKCHVSLISQPNVRPVTLAP